MTVGLSGLRRGDEGSGGSDTGPLDVLHLEAPALDREPAEEGRHLVDVGAGVEQRTEGHVAGDAGEGVEPGDGGHGRAGPNRRATAQAAP